MSLLKINNPRSLLLKNENPESNRNVVIRKKKIENRKIAIEIVRPPSPKKVVKNVNKTPDKKTSVEKNPVEKDEDLQMPSELFNCDFKDKKDTITEIPGEYYFETDHEALRRNPDYQKMLRMYSILQAKKIQVRFLYS